MRTIILLSLIAALAGCVATQQEVAQKDPDPSSIKKKLEKEEGEIASLDIRNNRNAAYFAHIRRKIADAWDPRGSKYPGTVNLKFVLRADGTLRRVEILSSSGVRLLDDAAVSAITDAAPFDPFPPALKAKKFLPIKGLFEYKLR